MNILSLGWGRQSFTLAAMIALGELDPIDFAIHADTRHECSETYRFAERWRGWLEERGVVVVVVVATHEKKNIIDKWGGMQLPAFTYGKDGSGQIRRQCIHEWKIRPIREYITLRLKEQGVSKTPGVVKQIIGISYDEYQRMKPADVQYIEHQYPLIDRKMSRADCENWLIKNNIEVPPRSACTFCPFKSTSEWRFTKSLERDWKEATDVDEMIRNARPPDKLFIHPSRKPLSIVDFRTEQEKGQMELWDNECAGVCGV